MFPFQHRTSSICTVLSRLFIFPAPLFLIFSTFLVLVLHNSVILKPGRLHTKKWVNDLKSSPFRVELSVKQEAEQSFHFTVMPS